MRVLFTPLASRSHVLPMVPLAWAFRTAGHEVQFAAQPRVTETITGCGFSAVAVGGTCDFVDESHNFLREHSHLMRPNGRLVILDGGPAGEFGGPWIRSGAAVAKDLLPYAEWWRPDLVVTDPMFYAGPLVADVLGVPLVRHLWGPDWTKSGFGMGGFRVGEETVEWPAALVELYESYGARTAVDFAACTVDPFPPSLQLPGLANRITMRKVLYNGAAEVPAWLAASPERPRVCVTGGGSNLDYLGDEGFFVPMVLDGLAGLDVEVVLALNAGDRRCLGTIPPGVRLVENLPFDLLLRSCSAFVSQGGAGGMITAATFGVPQVVLPQMGDQPTNARLLAATGAGIMLDWTACDAADVRAAVKAAVFDDGPREAARQISAEIQTLPMAPEIVHMLQRLPAK